MRVYVLFPSLTSSTYIALHHLCTLSIVDILDIALIFCAVFNAFNAMYLNTSNIKQCALTHIDTRSLMYAQQIR